MFFLFLLASCVAARLVKVPIVLGSNTLFIVYDTDQSPWTRMMHTTTENGMTYNVAVQGGGISSSVVCRQSTSRQIAVTPRGCDARNPKDALVDHFCEFRGDLVVQKAISDTLNQWTLPANSPQCVDPMACFGPVYLSSEKWTTDRVITDIDLLTSRRGVFVVSAGGPSGEIPMVTFIPVLMPQLILMGTCGMNGTYTLTATDSFEDATNHSYRYVYGDQTIRRFMLVRDGVDFRITFAKKGLGVNFYNQEMKSNRTFVDLIDVLSTEIIEFDNGCRTRIDVTPAVKPLELIPPELPDDLNYALNREGVGYRTSECALRRGAYDELGNWVYPDCPPKALCGGRIRFRSPGVFGQKYKITPRAEYRDFSWSCTKFWPVSSTFQGMGGGTYARDAPDELACYSPFPYPEMVLKKNGDVDEKLRQCKMLGGRGAMFPPDHCTFSIATTLCRSGFYFFDEACYYRFDVDKDAKYKTRQADAENACRQLHSQAHAVVALDEYAEVWMQTNYVYQPGALVRATVTGSRCRCYEKDESGVGVRYECSCETPQFPLCRYLMKDDWISWNDEIHHPATLQAMKDGQCDGESTDCVGSERYGKELECECIPGSTGQYCDRRTCIVNASTIVGDGLLLKFAHVCDKHGYCSEGKVDTCACEPGFGPPAQFGDRHAGVACLVPSTRNVRDSAGGYIIDDVLYFGPYSFVCNGASAGRGACDKATGICRCLCAPRLNLDPDGEGIEPAFDSINCAARTAMLPANGHQSNDGLVERLCNGKGTACPSGERLDGKRLDGTYVVTVDSERCRGKPDGCDCDDGMIGDACTGPVPRNVATKIPTFHRFGGYVPLKGERRPIKNVWIKPEAAYAAVEPTCDVSRVWVSETYLPSSACNKTKEEGRWWCGGAYGSFVVFETNEERPSCTVTATEDDFKPCGNHTDDRMGRMYANEFYRGWGRYDERQPQRFTQFGVTTTECAYDADHMGKLGRNRISSKRMDADGFVSLRACGETTLPPRGIPTDEGCSCNQIAGMNFESVGCSCATIEGLGLCGGVGRCVEPLMEYGRCEFDLMEIALDPVPFSVIDPANPASTYTIRDMDTGQVSVLVLDGESWLFGDGQTMDFESLRGAWATSCYQNVKFPINVTHSCENSLGANPPVRGIADVLIFEWTFVCDSPADSIYEECHRLMNRTASCDPAINCPTTRFCPIGIMSRNESTCLRVITWKLDEEDLRVLPSKRYENVWFMCANASRTRSKEDVDFPYGVFPTCADPVYRWIDDALVGNGLTAVRQCPGISHSNVRGEMYGLFDDVVPGLNFNKEVWGEAHYDFVASIMNDEICVNAKGDYVMDALTGEVVDQYAIDQIDVGSEDAVELSNTPSGPVPIHWVPLNETYSFDGLWGNPYYHPLNATLAETQRPGGWLRLPSTPTTRTIRKVTLRNGGNRTLDGFQLIGPRGIVCATSLGPFKPNDTFTVDCGTAFEAEPVAVSFARLYRTSANPQADAQAFLNQSSPYTLWYAPMNWMGEESLDFKINDFAYTSRATSYTSRWRAISASIIGNRTFPHNDAFKRSCTRLGGSTRARIRGSDDAFIKGTHAAHLAARRCTQDWQCKRFARNRLNWRCIPDATKPSYPWLNGPKGEVGLPGVREGGCEFAGSKELMDPEFSGSKCLPGYEAQWSDIVRYEVGARSAMMNVTEWHEPFVLLNLTEWLDHRFKCTIPSGFVVGRPTEACGGARGKLVLNTFNESENLIVFGANKIKRCSRIILDSQSYNNTYGDSLDLHTFVGSVGRVNVVEGGRTFVMGVEWTLAEPCGGDSCKYVEGDIRCVESTFSETHRVMTVGGLVRKRRDFWTDFIVI